VGRNSHAVRGQTLQEVGDETRNPEARVGAASSRCDSTRTWRPPSTSSRR
jgi:hypothetical protein